MRGDPQTVLSTVVFGERFTPVMGLGVGCVIAGVLLVETGTRHAPVEDVSA
ncbi:MULTISPECIES: hypothetical protein [unclassified Janibacter]|uniref:hypothetical protein n=1 Tax=unclassified Janibacter TaxID=2649294 RepID=UPI003F922430